MHVSARIQFVILLFLLLCTSSRIHAADQGHGGQISGAGAGSDYAQLLPENLTSIGLEKLLSFEVEVISPAKKPQKISEIPSAVFVLTQQDIKRSGATHVAEVLRLVPGISVAKISGSQWAITARGFNNVFENKLLVLIDGQSIFTETFNGVVWDQHEMPLENIERIEVIRGPGGALWGVNAVNGIINIITFKSSETKGTLVSAGGGTEERAFGTVRYGGQAGEATDYRVYARGVKRDNTALASGGDANDHYGMGMGGMRLDSRLSERDNLTFKTEGFYQDKQFAATVPSFDPPYVDPDTYSGTKLQRGASALGVWNRSFSDSSELKVQTDYAYENQTGRIYPIRRHNAHFDTQFRFSPVDAHDMIVGLDYRFYRDSFQGNFADDFDPEARSIHTFGGFVHDEISLIKDELKLIVGTKLAEHEQTGLEVMPNVRVWYAPTEQSSVWAAVSRSVSVPARVFEDTTIPFATVPDAAPGLPGMVTIIGNRDMRSEELLAYELGYRQQAAPNLSFDAALFYNNHDRISSPASKDPYVGFLRDDPRPVLIIPLVFEDELEANSYGIELSMDFKPFNWWRIVPVYSYIKIDVEQNPLFSKEAVDFIRYNTPQSQVSLRNQFDLWEGARIDPIMRFVDNVKQSNTPKYFELDLVFAMQLGKGLTLEVVGQNLLHDSHEEGSTTLFAPPLIEVERGVYGKLTWVY